MSSEPSPSEAGLLLRSLRAEPVVFMSSTWTTRCRTGRRTTGLRVASPEPLRVLCWAHIEVHEDGQSLLRAALGELEDELLLAPRGLAVVRHGRRPLHRVHELQDARTAWVGTLHIATIYWTVPTSVRPSVLTWTCTCGEMSRACVVKRLTAIQMP